MYASSNAPRMRNAMRHACATHATGNASGMRHAMHDTYVRRERTDKHPSTPRRNRIYSYAGEVKA